MKRKRVWLVKMEEDLPVDDDFFPHRMHVIADNLSESYDVTRFASRFNHKLRKDRPISGAIAVNDNYKIVLMKTLIRYGRSQVLRFLSVYFSCPATNSSY